MISLISIILIVISYVSLSESACSSDTWTAVPNIDPTRILGRWYATKRYANGQHGRAHCLWHNLYKHPTNPNTVVVTTNRMFRNGTEKIHTQEELTLVDPTKTEGVVRVAMENGANVIKYFVALDYDEYAFLRSCHDGIEFFWLYVRNLYPSNETMEKINEIIKEQQLDETKIITSCRGVRASDII